MFSSFGPKLREGSEWVHTRYGGHDACAAEGSEGRGANGYIPATEGMTLRCGGERGEGSEWVHTRYGGHDATLRRGARGGERMGTYPLRRA